MHSLYPLARQAKGEIAARQVTHHDGPHYFDLGYLLTGDVVLQKLFDDLQIGQLRHSQSITQKARPCQ